MRVRAPSSGSSASERLTRQITCRPIYTSLLPPSSHGFNFRLAFHPSGGVGTAVSIVAGVALLWWAIGEIGWGDSLFRRILGGVGPQALETQPGPSCGHEMPGLKGARWAICTTCGYKESCCY